MTYFCEICGKKADIHHIIHKHEGGLDFDLNYKFLCHYHHRGKNGPHRNKLVDLTYKLEIQKKLQNFLSKDFYNLDELSKLLHINKSILKKLFKTLKLHKEGYNTDEILFNLMGKKIYSYELIEELILRDIESKII